MRAAYPPFLAEISDLFAGTSDNSISRWRAVSAIHFTIDHARQTLIALMDRGAQLVQWPMSSASELLGVAEGVSPAIHARYQRTAPARLCPWLYWPLSQPSISVGPQRGLRSSHRAE
jgi:hypothetical protein